MGYTLNLKDLFCNFNVKRLKLSAAKCEEVLKNRHKEIIAFSPAQLLSIKISELQLRDYTK